MFLYLMDGFYAVVFHPTSGVEILAVDWALGSLNTILDAEVENYICNNVGKNNYINTLEDPKYSEMKPEESPLAYIAQVVCREPLRKVALYHVTDAEEIVPGIIYNGKKSIRKASLVGHFEIIKINKVYGAMKKNVPNVTIDPIAHANFGNLISDFNKNVNISKLREKADCAVAQITAQGIPQSTQTENPSST